MSFSVVGDYIHVRMAYIPLVHPPPSTHVLVSTAGQSIIHERLEHLVAGLCSNSVAHLTQQQITFNYCLSVWYRPHVLIELCVFLVHNMYPSMKPFWSDTNVLQEVTWIYLSRNTQKFAHNQALPYMLIAIAEVLATVASSELFYSQVGWFSARVVLIDAVPFHCTTHAEVECLF